MKFIIVIAALIAAVGVFVLIQKRKPLNGKQPATGSNARLSESSRFHAVSLKTGISACREARAIVGKRYLSGAAPRIPLPGCDDTECKCRFVHHVDRRGGDDRRTPYPSSIGLDSGIYKKNQRKASERRKEPPNAW